MSAALLTRLIREGAGGVLLAPCPPTSRCAPRCVAAAKREVGAARAVLQLVGRDDRSVRVLVCPPSALDIVDALRSMPRGFLARAKVASPRTLAGEARLLAEEGAVGRLTARGLDCGVASISRERCTLCGLCTDACPTEALAAWEEGTETEIIFRHDACHACGLCVGACPHEALRVERVLDLNAARDAPVVLARSEVPCCKACRRPLPPERLLAHVGARVATTPAWKRLMEYCPACRIVSSGD